MYTAVLCWVHVKLKEDHLLAAAPALPQRCLEILEAT